MERNVFNDCWVWLQKFHGKRDMISAESQDTYFAAFKDEHDNVFCEGVSISTEKLAPGQFPSIEKLRRFCTEAREKIHEQQKAVGAKNISPVHADKNAPAGDIRNTERGIEALALVKQIAGEGYSAEVLAAIVRLAARSPSWAKENWQREIEACAEIRANVARRAEAER